MSFRLVIFDCDGVLFDSKQANIAFYNHIRSHFGLPPLTSDAIQYVCMATVKESIDYIFEDERTRAEAQNYRLTLDYAPFGRLMVMEPDLPDLLDFLRPSIKTAVCTNRSDTIRPIMNDFGLTPYFDIIVSSLDVTHPKPDPESVFLILDQLNIPSTEALYVGDSEIDARTAQAACVRMAAYRNRQLEADYHIDRLLQIKDIVRRPG